MKMRMLTLSTGLLMTLPALALEGPVPAAGTRATAATTPAPAQPTTNSKNVHLGKIDVQGLQPLVQTLQEIKVAVKRPFDNEPAHFDDMVCRLGDGSLGSHMSSTLECGTEGWFAMRRNQYLFGNGWGGEAAVSTLGHPWHTVRALNPHQMMVLRELLRELPPPGQGPVEVVGDGKAPLEPSR